MLRERVACAYPGTASVGLSLWVLEDKILKRVALGSAATSAVNGVLERFRPDILVIEPERQAAIAAGPFKANAYDLTYVHPGWTDHPRRQPVGKIGALAQNAWRMGWHHLIRRGPYFVGDLEKARISPQWLEANAPPRRPHAA